VRALVERNHSVSALLRHGASHPLLEGIRFKTIQGDLFSQKILDDAIKECDAVIHCAAVVSFDEKNWRETYQVNVTGTDNILKAALKHNKRVVFVSTASTIGTPRKQQQIMDETTPYSFEDRNPYTHSKHIAEKHVQLSVKQGLDATIVNPSSVYGKGDIHGTGTLLYGLIEKYPVFIAPPGGCSVVAVQDVVAGIIAALEKGKKGERYILTSENITYHHLFCLLRTVIKRSSFPLMRAPQFLGSWSIKTIRALNLSSPIITPSVLSYLFNYRYLDNSKARKDLRWEPVVDIERAINEGYAFYCSARRKENNGNK
jgi:dihydroflavonol-4-reductase